MSSSDVSDDDSAGRPVPAQSPVLVQPVSRDTPKQRATTKLEGRVFEPVCANVEAMLNLLRGKDPDNVKTKASVARMLTGQLIDEDMKKLQDRHGKAQSNLKLEVPNYLAPIIQALFPGIPDERGATATKPGATLDTLMAKPTMKEFLLAFFELLALGKHYEHHKAELKDSKRVLVEYDPETKKNVSLKDKADRPLDDVALDLSLLLTVLLPGLKGMKGDSQHAGRNDGYARLKGVWPDLLRAAWAELHSGGEGSEDRARKLLAMLYMLAALGFQSNEMAVFNTVQKAERAVDTALRKKKPQVAALDPEALEVKKSKTKSKLRRAKKREEELVQELENERPAYDRAKAGDEDNDDNIAIVEDFEEKEEKLVKVRAKIKRLEEEKVKLGGLKTQSDKVRKRRHEAEEVIKMAAALMSEVGVHPKRLRIVLEESSRQRPVQSREDVRTSWAWFLEDAGGVVQTKMF